MIDSEKTLELFGYRVADLTHGSQRKIICRCDNCGKERVVEKKSYRELCNGCAARSEERCRKVGAAKKGHVVTEETRKKIGDANRGRIPTEETRYKLGKPYRGKHLSAEHRRKISDAQKGRPLSKEHRQKLTGKKRTMEMRIRLSAAHQYIPEDEWDGFSKDSPYCSNFNESCRESNRQKYNRECFICGKPEKENITKTGKQKKLSVHHVDMNKDQGCNDHQWKLVPVCIGCHNLLHNPTWAARLRYLKRGETTEGAENL